MQPLDRTIDGPDGPRDRPVLRSRVWPIALGGLAVLIAVLATVGVDHPPATTVTLAFTLVVTAVVLTWAALRTRAQRRDYEHELTAWAAERAVHAERLRIARDLHDLASHGLGLVTLRAAAARTVAGPDGDAERVQALADIERAGRRATHELRRMLTVLRDPEAEAPLRPADTLADLPAIVAATGATGVRATLTDASAGSVTAGAQVAVCAVVREGLANVARHAGPTAARVDVRREPGGVVVVVDDDGPVPGWRPHPGAGHGLAGLAERVAAMDGTLEAGTRGSGFRLAARLPDAGEPAAR
ncbi:sensor histidine kinase [Salana multivorans]|uniref:sensor histidine kinase n=1 Tax=Salana multivorans TaxID=120377 RepID=UPI001B8723D3|nr:histidine kinase [Salana multivorans]